MIRQRDIKTLDCEVDRCDIADTKIRHFCAYILPVQILIHIPWAIPLKIYTPRFTRSHHFWPLRNRIFNDPRGNLSKTQNPFGNFQFFMNPSEMDLFTRLRIFLTLGIFHLFLFLTLRNSREPSNFPPFSHLDPQKFLWTIDPRKFSTFSLLTLRNSIYYPLGNLNFDPPRKISCTGGCRY